ncbi:fimbria/pilus periplasmic chaperone [Pseudomonas chlororaphis]|uniref:fimbria/pilus periplasmic chaperone n=1 Tax=Pseudomonas chlororaphis TaxID=587753 RepID=UPI001B32D7E4|nr:fimbria/pilus periplasmic chaperone [Pseudomonas chlororaphis]
MFKFNTSLPDDRESMLWLNVNSILPGLERQNSVRLASRTRLKIFARSAGLAGQPENVETVQEAVLDQ